MLHSFFKSIIFGLGIIGVVFASPVSAATTEKQSMEQQIAILQAQIAALQKQEATNKVNKSTVSTKRQKYTDTAGMSFTYAQPKKLSVTNVRLVNGLPANARSFTKNGREVLYVSISDNGGTAGINLRMSILKASDKTVNYAGESVSVIERSVTNGRYSGTKMLETVITNTAGEETGAIIWLVPLYNSDKTAAGSIVFTTNWGHQASASKSNLYTVRYNNNTTSTGLSGSEARSRAEAEQLMADLQSTLQLDQSKLIKTLKK